MRTVLIGTGSIGGIVAVMIKEHGVPTSVNDKLTRMIKEIENSERRISVANIEEL